MQLIHIANGVGIHMGLNATVIIVIALLVAIPGIIAYGAFRWEAGTKELRTRLADARLPISPVWYDIREIKNLPPAGSTILSYGAKRWATYYLCRSVQA